MKNTLYLGTSGWSYKGWRGTFYPENLPQKDWLSHYAKTFDCVEVNSTFYGMPSEKTIKHWHEQVPASFQFTFKLSRYVTHMKKLKDGEERIQSFARRLQSLAKQLGPLLVQLPPNFKAHPERLAHTLSCLGDTPLAQHPIAVEFRNPDWYSDDIYALLEKHGAAMVLHDMPGSACRKPYAGQNLVYVRFHGPKGDYGGSYTKTQLNPWAKSVKHWLKEGHNVHVFFNNDKDGYAIEDAQKLRELVGEA